MLQAFAATVSLGACGAHSHLTAGLQCRTGLQRSGGWQHRSSPLPVQALGRRVLTKRYKCEGKHYRRLQRRNRAGKITHAVHSVDMSVDSTPMLYDYTAQENLLACTAETSWSSISSSHLMQFAPYGALPGGSRRIRC